MYPSRPISAAGSSPSVRNNRTERHNVFNQADFRWLPKRDQRTSCSRVQARRQVTDNLRHTGYFVGLIQRRHRFPCRDCPDGFGSRRVSAGATDANSRRHNILPPFTRRTRSNCRARSSRGRHPPRPLRGRFPQQSISADLTSVDNLVSPRVGLITNRRARLAVQLQPDVCPRAGDALIAPLTTGLDRKFTN